MSDDMRKFFLGFTIFTLLYLYLNIQHKEREVITLKKQLDYYKFKLCE